MVVRRRGKEYGLFLTLVSWRPSMMDGAATAPPAKMAMKILENCIVSDVKMVLVGGKVL